MFSPLDLPPGLYRNGTERNSRGRWYDANLARFYEGTIKPVAGWRVKSTAALTGSGRAIIAWKTKNLTRYAAIGTHSKLYAMDQAGVLYDITPAGFTAGNSDAIAGGGFGSGLYGVGPFGAPGSDTSNVQDCTTWSLETFGEDLIGGTADDGKLYQWTRNTGVVAAVIVNAPTGCRACVVTAERFILALGAGGDPRMVQWPDQQSLTVWTPASTNQAGSFPLQTAGKLMLGKKVRGATLLLTDIDAWLCTWIGGTGVFRFDPLGDGCGAASQNCLANFDGNAAWMGRGNFWIYNGFVQPLPCDVQDYVYSNINLQQISKVSAHADTEHGEITWYYPSSNSLENDSYVTWSYRAWERGEKLWTFGTLARMSGCDRGTFQYGLRVGTDGYVYEHEVGSVYQEHSGATQTPYLETGPYELGNGDKSMRITRLIPDDKNPGDVTITLKTKLWPQGAESSYGPFTPSGGPVDLRAEGRQVKFRFTAAMADDWRIGSYRLDVKPGAGR